MSKLSKFYKVTNQIMIEYISNQNITNEDQSSRNVRYTIYTGLDNNVYYTETPPDTSNNKLDYSQPQYFINISV